jgi:hypothetical protein
MQVVGYFFSCFNCKPDLADHVDIRSQFQLNLFFNDSFIRWTGLVGSRIYDYDFIMALIGQYLGRNLYCI